MEKYYLLSTTADRITRKMELVGFDHDVLSVKEGLEVLNGTNSDTIIVENCILNNDVLEERKQSGKYAYCIEYKEHTIFTNEKFLSLLVVRSFKPKTIEYYDNFPEAKMELAKFHMPVIIRPYGESDVNYIYLIRDYSKGIEAIYDSLEKSRHRHVIIESYI